MRHVRPVICDEDALRLSNVLFNIKLRPPECANRGIYTQGTFTWRTKFGGKFPVVYALRGFKDNGELVITYRWNSPSAPIEFYTPIQLVLRTWGLGFFEWLMVCPLNVPGFCKKRTRTLYLANQLGFACAGCLNIHAWGYSNTPRHARIRQLSHEPDQIHLILANSKSRTKDRKIALEAMVRYEKRAKKRAAKEKRSREQLQRYWAWTKRKRRRWKRWASAPLSLVEDQPPDSPYQP